MSKKIPHLQDTSSLVGKRVRVHRDAKRDVWSVFDLDECSVVAFVDSVRLLGAEFHVSESGRHRVIREQKDYLHTWIHGVVTGESAMRGLDTFRLSYNPYKSAYFMRKMAENIFQRVTHCPLVVLHSDGKVTGGIPL
jgi:hypothetical protein